MNRKLVLHGFILIFLALVGGFFIAGMPIPRLGLSAHTAGLLSGTLFIAIGAVWSQFVLSSRQAKVMYGSWLYAGYVNWLGCLVGAIFGAGRTTPVAAAGIEGPEAAELAVSIMLISVGVVSLLAAGLSLWGLRKPRRRSE